MTEIEEGDRVMISSKKDDDFPDSFLGKIGIVSNIEEDENTYDYKVEFEDDWNYFWEEEMELFPQCDIHEDAIYHDKREKWVCPFCDL